MRHSQCRIKLGRNTSHRALLRNLTTSVRTRNRVVTTVAKARPCVLMLKR